jgi:Cytidine deaminase
MTANPLPSAEREALVAAATAARENAAGPLLDSTSERPPGRGRRIFGGCNVESASYGLTCCAERTAVFKAISEGGPLVPGRRRRDGRRRADLTVRACRQVLWDQCRNISVVMATTGGKLEETTLAALLPRAFEL